MIGSSTQHPWRNAVVLGLLALAALVPFNFMPNARVAGIPLHFFVFVPAGLVMLAVSAQRAAEDKRVPRFALYALAIVASMTLSSFVPGSSREGLSATAGILLRCVAIGWFSFLAAREEGTATLATGLAVLGAIVAAAALYEPLTGHYFIFTRAITSKQGGGELWEPWRRIAVGAIGQPLPLAALLNLFLPFALAEWQVRRRWFWAAPAALILLAIFMTFRRSGYLVALIISGVFIFQFQGNRRMTAMVAGAVAACAALVFAFPSPRRILADRFNPSATLHEVRDSHRTHVYGTVATMVARHPVFGIGTRQYERQYTGYATYANAWDTPDNQYLRFLAEGGLLGFGAFMAFLVHTLRRLWEGRADGWPFLVAVAGFAALLILLDGLYWPATGMAFFAIAGAGAGRLEKYEETK